MQEHLTFPFQAAVRLPLRGESREEVNVTIVELDPLSEEEQPIRLGIVEKGGKRVQYISPGAIARLDTSGENIEVINDWLYWHEFDLL